jgi:hypothetical protein
MALKSDPKVTCEGRIFAMMQGVMRPSNPFNRPAADPPENHTPRS